MNVNTTKQATASTCQETDSQKSRHLRRKNILKKFLAKNAKQVSRWVTLCTSCHQKERAGITMRSVGKRCFTDDGK